MAVVRKKQDDKYLLALRELVTSGAGNRQCFDCGQKGPTYVNMTIGSFVCTRCSGVLRGLTPPHRVKSISMATFTQEEIDFLRSHGNELCAKTWLGLWDPKRAAHQQQQDQRELITDKYERKRYYLEPASPLKSLNLKAAAPVNLHSHNGHHHNGVTVSTLSSNGYASIHLTPPAAQRTTANGLHKGTPVSSSSATSTSISRPQHHHHSNNNHDAFGLNGVGLTSLNSAGSTSTGALSDTSSCASNGFAGETDFVADFGSANIFDATSARSAGSPAVSSASSVSSTNGYAKVQPIRAAHLHQQQQQQQQQLNGSQGAENFADFDHAPIFNGVAPRAVKALPPMFNGWVSDWSRHDFHDPFDDRNWLPPKPQTTPAAIAPPAAAASRVIDEPALNWSFWQEQMQMEPEPEMEYSMIQRTSSTNSWYSSGEEPPLSPTNPFLSAEPPLPPPSRASYLLFSSLSSSFPEEEEYEYQAEEAAAAQPPVEQQNQEPNPTSSSSQDSDILNANFSDFFTWSAPLQNGHTPPAGHKGHSATAVAPSEDRYAALKDLDEQLRELKASESSASEAPTPTNGNNNNNNGHQATDAFGSALINNNPNPFKSQQQQQQMLSNHVVNPFQQQQQQQQNLYGQLTLIPNAYGSSPQQQQQQQTNFFNFNNNGYAMGQGLPNGCGFGSMQPAPVMANNPFAASGAMNTNNPFL
ncbi:arf-GAP domain and FG repeat-containing protein 1 isoform X2 [Drosophila subobscura]|uniref:arf-GAP domain and FG repeat-containing protein 1 isoform X2 n=2 Tax=Drosophila subobscura TaxID=7241 RepID=UPI00155AC61C|nr:arf-GAP domain and FG repeat-containing protein 1 isoform X2 [Drosophila subobscura]